MCVTLAKIIVLKEISFTFSNIRLLFYFFNFAIEILLCTLLSRHYTEFVFMMVSDTPIINKVSFVKI